MLTTLFDILPNELAEAVSRLAPSVLSEHGRTAGARG